MVDIHIHILPGVDDGAENPEDSLGMAALAAACGTDTIAATPHCNVPGIYETPWEKGLKQKFQALRQLIQMKEIPLTICPGMELFATEDLPEKLRDGELITLNHTRYPLVEFDFETDEDFIFYTMDRLLDFNYTPVLAHPERYRCTARNPQMIYELYRMGIVIQINKGSVLGRFGRTIQQTAELLLKHRLAAVAASDAHGQSFRTPDLSDFRDILDWDYGSGCSPLLLEENPRRILENREVLWDDPIPFV